MLHTHKPRGAQEPDDDDSDFCPDDFWDESFIDWQKLDPAKLEPRRWIYGRHYLAGALSVTVADGGVGKSALVLTEAVAIAARKPLLGVRPTDPPDGHRYSVLYYNAEESLAEIKRRVLAICQQHGLDPKELTAAYQERAPLRVVSGHDCPLLFGGTGPGGFHFNEEALKMFCSNINDEDVMIFDPFVSLHGFPENDNTAIDALAKRLARIAATRPIKAVEVVHHARKPAQGGTADIGAADARGASALVNAARSVRTLNLMTEPEALRAKLSVEDHRRYFRAINVKSNYAASGGEPQWYHHASVILPNGDDQGVVLPWRMPGAFDGVTTAHMQAVRELARGGKYRADPRSPAWIGAAVADVLELDAEADADKRRIKTLLKTWYATGVLAKAEHRSADRHTFIYVEPGQWEP